MRQPMERHGAIFTTTALVLAFALAAPVHAQRASSWSLGAGLGAGGSFTGTSVKDGPWIAYPVVDLTLMVRARPSRNSFVFGLNATGPWFWASNDMCAPAPGGGCLPEHAGFLFTGLLAGWESRGGRLRALGGPAFALSDGPHPAFGLQSRVEASVPIMRYVSLNSSLRAGLVPTYDSATYSLVGAGIGLRFHGR